MYREKIIKGVIAMVSEHFNLMVNIGYLSTNMNPEYHAFCTPVSEGFYLIEAHPNFLKSCTEEELVRVISHEVVHVKQFELEEISEKAWKHQELGGELDYWFAPWEVEARGYEQAFVALWNQKWEEWV